MSSEPTTEPSAKPKRLRRRRCGRRDDGERQSADSEAELGHQELPARRAGLQEQSETVTSGADELGHPDGNDQVREAQKLAAKDEPNEIEANNSDNDR
jgi:hypothetical protein